MNKLIIALFCLVYSNFFAQKATEKAQPYILDTTQLTHLHYFMEALRAKSIGGNMEALQILQEYLKNDQKNPAAYFETSRIEDEINNAPAAIEHASKAYSMDKNNKFYLENNINILTKYGKINEAIAVLKEVIDSKKADDVLKLQYAYLLSLSDNPKKAISILTEFEKNGEYNEAISYEKIKIYINQKDFKGAESELKKMVTNNPNDTRFLANMAEFYLKTNQIESADKVFNEILAVEPNNASALIYKAEYFRSKKDIENYKKVFNQLINNKEIDLDTKLQLISDRYSSRTQLDSLEKKYLVGVGISLVSQYPNEAKVHQILGDVFYMDRNFPGAKKAYQKSLSLNNNENGVWQNFFFTLMAMKEYQEVIDSSTTALDLFPANGMMHYYIGLAQSNLKKYESAEKSLRRALRFVGEDPNMESQIYTSLGEMYHYQKKYKEMDEAFESAINIDPDNAYTLNNYAYFLSLRKDRLESAKAMSKKSLDIEGKNSSFLDTYAWINFQLEKYEEAKIYQEKALEYGKDDMSTIYEHYGDILIKLNDEDKALKYWNMAKTAGSANKSLPTKISTKKYVDYIE